MYHTTLFTYAWMEYAASWTEGASSGATPSAATCNQWRTQLLHAFRDTSRIGGLSWTCCAIRVMGAQTEDIIYGCASISGIKIPEGDTLWSVLTPQQENGALDVFIDNHIAQVSP